MIRGRAGFFAMLLLVLLASCSLPRPTVGLAVAGTNVPGSREGSYCQSGGCGGACGDGPAPVAPVTVVRVGAPIKLDFSAGSDVSQIHGDIWRGDTASGIPLESFLLTGEQRSYTSYVMGAGRYYLFVSLGWSRLLDRGDTSIAFVVEIVPP